MADNEAHRLRSRHTAATPLWSLCHSCAHIRLSSLLRMRRMAGRYQDSAHPRHSIRLRASSCIVEGRPWRTVRTHA